MNDESRKALSGPEAQASHVGWRGPSDTQARTLTTGEQLVGFHGPPPEPDLIAALDLDGQSISLGQRITLRGLHSTGGIGEVWRAYDETLCREIALKRLKVDKAQDAGNRSRFLREARITGQLDHPGIVPVYDFSTSEDGTRCFYTMRFLRGRTLREVIREFHEQRVAEHLPLVTGQFVQLLGYFASVCNTMAFAHSRRIIHRDLKGDNVIVGDFGEVVVLDWGLAKELDGEGDSFDRGSELALDRSPSETVQGEQLGTPIYMSPEQASGDIDRIDYRTDVYGLAAILYDILAGRAPFRGSDVATVLESVITTEPRAPSTLVSGVPPELESICLAGLAKLPEDRPQSVTELAAQVQAWLDALTDRKRTERERERFFDLSLDLLAILDDDGRFLQSNTSWESLLGLTAELRTDVTFSSLVDPDDQPSVTAELQAIQSGRLQQTSFEARMRAVRGHGLGNGPTRWVDWSVRTIPGEPALYLVGRDITERKHADQEFRGLLESAPDAMIVVDESGRMRFANQRVEVLFGYSRNELIGQPIGMLVPDRHREAHAHHVGNFFAAPRTRTMGDSRSQLMARHRDGSEIAVEISLGPVAGREGPMVCCAIRAGACEATTLDVDVNTQSPLHPSSSPSPPHTPHPR